MKKFITLFLIATLALGAVSCATKANGELTTNEEKINLDGEIEGEISVSFHDNMPYKEYLEEAVLKFEEKYPNTKINIKDFSVMPEMKTITQDDGTTLQLFTTAGEDPQEITDYINKVNTELMSGNAADIYAMDVLPSYKYADGGFIEDLNKYIEADKSFDITQYRENVINSMKYKGGQYMFPIEFSFSYLAYDNSLLDEKTRAELENKTKFSYKDLLGIGGGLFDNLVQDKENPTRFFEAFNGEQLFQNMFMVDYKKYIDIENKKANFSDGQFVALLNELKSFGDKGYIDEFVEKELDLTEMKTEDIKINDIQSMIDVQSQKKILFKTKNALALLTDVYKSESTTFQTFGMAGGGSNIENDKVAGLISNDDGEVSTEMGQFYSINSNSKNKKLAWEFIKFLASEDMQDSWKILGYPINNNAFDKKAKEEITGEFYVDPTEKAANKEVVLTEEEKLVYDKYLALLNKLSDSINTNFFYDNIVTDIVLGEVSNYFNGTKTAEEVAAFIQNKADLYLSE